MAKEGFTPIMTVRNFLYGLRNRKHSKPYVRVEEIDGYYHLCVYLDNSYTQDEVTVATDLNEINGFRKFYSLKLNKIEK